MPRKYKRHCDNCEKYYEGEGVRFCCYPCSVEYIVKHPKTQTKPIKRCLNCGRDFELTKNRKKFCSKKCSDKKRIGYKNPKTVVIRKCLSCEKDFETRTFLKKKYCSDTCYFSMRRKMKVKKKCSGASRLKDKYSVIKARAKRHNLSCDDFSLFEYWHSQQLNKCSYCDIPFEIWEIFYRGHQNKYSLTIDRKDNDIGYIISNLALACSQCNVIKSNILTSEEMREIGQKYVKPKWQRLSIEEKQNV